MRRRDFIKVIGGTVAWPLTARAQQPAMPVVGFLNVASPDGYRPMVAAFRQGLKESGYVEDRNVAIEFRWAGGRTDQLPAMAAELVHRKPLIGDPKSTPPPGGPPPSNSNFVSPVVASNTASRAWGSNVVVLSVSSMGGSQMTSGSLGGHLAARGVGVTCASRETAGSVGIAGRSLMYSTKSAELTVIEAS
jgi:hypothetical protein